MTLRPITITSGDTIASAADLLRTCRIRHLPVVSGRVLSGLLTLGDVLAARDEVPVAQAMTTPVETAAMSEPLPAACSRMLGRGLSCLPVILEDGALIGLFTATDALRAAAMALDKATRQGRPAPRVADVMAARPAWLASPTTPLGEAWERMRGTGIRYLPVLDGANVVGILSDRDVLAAGRSTCPPVGEAMSQRVSLISDDRPAADAASTLLRRRVGAVPVLRDGELCGVVTAIEFVSWLAAHG